MTIDDTAREISPLAAAGANEWSANRHAAVKAILEDARFGVAEAPPNDSVGTVGWLRAAVTRFVNGAEHGRRRSLAVEEIHHLDPDALYSEASRRTLDALSAGKPGERIDVMERLARRLPMTAMAAAMGLTEPEGVADAVIRIARSYFPGADAATRAASDVATAELLATFDGADIDIAVTRIAVLVQGCDATAGLIGATLFILQEAPEASAAWSTEALLIETLRHSPPLLATRRIALADISVPGSHVRTGDVVMCQVEAANRDPAIFAAPELFDPDRPPRPSLTFGHGLRPCPGAPQAMALARGVVDAVRARCTLLAGTPIDYEAGFLRIPAHLEVVLT